MHVEQVHFDDVFDVEARRGDFSFSSRGRTQYGVKLPSHVIPRKGSIFAVAFAEPGKWTTVLGWRDLTSGTVTLKHPTWSIWFSKLSDTILYGPFFIVGGLLAGGLKGMFAVVVAIACIVLFQIFRAMRFNQAVKQALLANGPENGQFYG